MKIKNPKLAAVAALNMLAALIAAAGPTGLWRLLHLQVSTFDAYSLGIGALFLATAFSLVIADSMTNEADKIDACHIASIMLAIGMGFSHFQWHQFHPSVLQGIKLGVESVKIFFYTFAGLQGGMFVAMVAWSFRNDAQRKKASLATNA